MLKVKCLARSGWYFGSACRVHKCIYTMHVVIVVWSGRHMGSACRVLRKITLTHGIQPKISVCLSEIRKHSRSRAARSGQGLLILVNHFFGRRKDSTAPYECIVHHSVKAPERNPEGMSLQKRFAPYIPWNAKSPVSMRHSTLTVHGGSCSGVTTGDILLHVLPSDHCNPPRVVAFQGDSTNEYCKGM